MRTLSAIDEQSYDTETDTVILNEERTDIMKYLTYSMKS